MRVRALAAIGVAWGLATAGVHAQQQFQLYATILDGTGAPPASIQPDEIRVMEDGVEARVLTVESVNLPTKVQILLDNGVGIGGDNISHLRNGVRGLIDALPPGVEVTLVVTAGQPRFLVRATTDRAAILKGFGLMAPEGGAGRFVEALLDATERIEKDKSDYAPVIVAFATTAGDINVMERDGERLSKRIQARPTTVHVVLLSLLGTRSALGGANQTEVGVGLTKMTGGRFESIAAPSRLATLLPEIGTQVAQAHERQSRQFKITAERPAGTSGELKNLSLGARGGLGVTAVSLDGRVPN
jgi:hypothetical protein